MNKKIILILALLCQFLISAKDVHKNTIYIDAAVSGLKIPSLNIKSSEYHLFSHGKTGELFIDNQWLNAAQISTRFKNELKGKKEIYIYGCNFGEGETGKKAVLFLEKTLHINVNASTNITGKDGDWNLELGKGKNELKFPNYNGSLQLSTTHYLNPLIAGSYNNGFSIDEEFIYLSTPTGNTANPITVQMNYASGTGAPRVSVTNLRTNNTTYLNGGTLTFSNVDPIRLRFITSGTAVINPGTTPTTLPLNNAGTIISGSSAGLVFTSTDKFYVNYRARSTAQAGSMMTKGTAALGKEFRWGGSPTENKTTTVDIGNMLSVMATENNTTIVINNIKPGTKFVNGTDITMLTGPSITKLLQKGDSFVLYAPVVINSLTIQDTGWLGAKVVSDKDIAVAVGGLMQQGNNPDGNGRDIGFDQLVPVDKLGLEHIVMAGNGGNDEKVIVVATQVNTMVYANGTLFTTLVNAGDYTLIPSSNFNGDKNMFVRVTAPAYVFHKIFGSNSTGSNTNSLMFIPPTSCFGQKTVDLIPDPTQIGTTDYTGTQLVVLAAAGNANKPVVVINGTIITAPVGGSVTNNLNWNSYRYNLANTAHTIKVSSAGPIQAEIFGANSAAGFGGYYSGFGEVSSYTISVNSPYGFLCPDTGTLSVPVTGTEAGFQWYRNNVAISGATSSTYTLSGVGDSVLATYYVIVSFVGGCTVTSNQVKSETCPCEKPGIGGTPDGFTKLGITIRDNRTTANWPYDVGNGFLTMEANQKGFVITRIASPDTAIADPVIGMLIYNTTLNCLQLYNGTEWKCIKPTCN